MPGAAADFNRALALAPSDLAILKRIGSLTSSAGRRVMLRRAALILGVSAELGLLAFGVARGLRARKARLDAEALASAAEAASSASSAAPPISARPIDSGPIMPRLSPSASRTSRPVQRLLPPLPSAAPVPPGDRSVRFVVNPPGAKLTVDGRDVNWFSTTVALLPGPHVVSAFMANSKCCKPITATTVTVVPAPADNPGSAQTIALSLEVFPASVTLGERRPTGSISARGSTSPALRGARRKSPSPSQCGRESASSPPRPTARRVPRMSRSRRVSST